MEVEQSYRVCVVGDKQVGKTSLIHKLVSYDRVGSNKTDLEATKRLFSIAGYRVTVEFIEREDTMEKDKELKKFYDGMDAVFFLVSLDNIETLCTFTHYAEEVEKYSTISDLSYVIATKSDATAEIVEEEITRLAKNVSIHYARVSCSNDDGIEKLLYELQDNIYDDIKRHEDKKVCVHDSFRH